MQEFARVSQAIIEDYPAQAAVPPLAGFPVRNFNRSIIRSLTPQQAAGNALAITGHGAVQSKKLTDSSTD